MRSRLPSHRFECVLGLTTLFGMALGVDSCVGIRPLNADGGTIGAGGTGGTIAVNLPDGATDDTGARDLGAADVPGGCQNLVCQQTTCTKGACQQAPCPVGQKTTVSGTVFDPAGRVPLYSVAVFVPNVPLKPLTQGVSCGRCQATIADAVTATLSDVNGHFTRNDVPVGTNIPLVVQVG